MSEFEAELSAALRPAAELHEPPCALDLDRARVHGRRLRRRRQGLQAGAAMAATALVAVLVTGSLSGGGGAAVVPASPPATSGGESANDPVTTGITFGWLPSGFHVTGGGTEGTFDNDLAAGNGKTTLFVAVQSSGGGVAGNNCGYVRTFGSHSAAPIYSCSPSASASGLQHLSWDPAPGSSQAIAQHYAKLGWQVADGGQAFLFAGPGDETADQLTAIMLRVAENVRLGGHRALPMPFHLAKPPTGLAFAYGYTSQGADGTPPGEAANGDPIGTGPAPGVAAGLEYGGIDATMNDQPGFELAVQKADSDAAFPDQYELQIDGGPPAAADIHSITVDGHPARIATKGLFEVLVVHDVNGFDVRLSVGGDANAQSFVDKAGGLIGYFHTITFFGTDPATWTVDVLGR